MRLNAEQLDRKVTAISGFTHAAGVEMLAAEAGRVSLSLAKKPELLQFNGFFHGGMVSGLTDHAAGAAATTALPAGKIAVTVEVETDSPTGQQLCAIATVTLRVVDMPSVGSPA